MKLTILVLSALIFSVSAQAHYTSSHTADHTYKTWATVANPDRFRFISVNGRAVATAIAPCPVKAGLISCALDKLELVNSLVTSVNNDYDQVQVFYYPNTEQPDTAVVIATKTGLLDDSVSGERYRVSFKLKGDGRANAEWHLVQYGVQYLCARGRMQGLWVKTSCP